MREPKPRTNPSHRVLMWLLGAVGPIVTGFGASLEHLNFQTFVDSRDLPSPWVKSVHQDHRGFVWLVTNNNLVRYDGERFVTYTPDPDQLGSFPSSKPIAIASDSDGGLWVTAPQGLCKFREDSETFDVFELYDDGISLLQSTQALIETSSRQIMVGGLKGLFIFDPIEERWTRRYTEIGDEETRVRKVVEEQPGKFVLGSSNGMWRFDLESEEFARLRFVDGEGTNIGERAIASFLIDESDRFWLATERGRLFCFGSDSIEIPFTIDGVPSEETEFIRFRDVYQDGDGVIWAASLQHGLIALPPNSLDFQRIEADITIDQTVQDSALASIQELNDGSILFSTVNSGVFALDAKRVPLDFFPVDGRPGSFSVRNLNHLTHSPNGDIWLASARQQIQRYDPDTRRFSSPIADASNATLLKNKPILSLSAENQDNLFILTDSEILVYDTLENSLRRLDIDLEELGLSGRNFPFLIHCDRFGELWLVGRTISRYNLTTNEVTQFPAPSIFSDGLIRAISFTELRDGSIWFGTRQRGIHLYDRSADAFTQEFTNRRFPARMSQRHVHDLRVDRSGNLWLATNTGLVFLDRNLELADYFADIEEIGKSSIRGLEIDSAGMLWLASSRGLFRFDPGKRVVYRFSGSRGVAAQNFPNRTMAISSDGVLSIGSFQGLNLIDTTRMPDAYRPIKPIVTGIFTTSSVEGKTGYETQLRLRGGWNEALVLGHNSNAIAFQFTSFNFNDDPDTVLLYKIDGLLEDWTEIENKNELEFP